MYEDKIKKKVRMDTFDAPAKSSASFPNWG